MRKPASDMLRRISDQSPWAHRWVRAHPCGGGRVFRVRIDDSHDGGATVPIAGDLEHFDGTVWGVRCSGDLMVIDAATDGAFG